MRNIAVVFVNGYPRAGKDSFVDACHHHLIGIGKAVDAFSSITPVIDLLRLGGIDTSAKTDADRKLLADVGFALEEHSAFRTEACISFCVERMRRSQAGGYESVVFLHIREPANIRRVRGKLATLGIDSTVIRVTGQREIRPQNVADTAVEGIDYDATVSNNGTLEDLSLEAARWLKMVGLV